MGGAAKAAKDEKSSFDKRKTSSKIGILATGPAGRAASTKGGRDFLQTHFDPFDISGQRGKADEKAYQKAQAKEDKRRKAEVDALVKQGGKLQIDRAADIRAQQIAPKLAGNLNQASADVGYLRGISQSGELTPGAQREMARQRLEERGNIEGIRGAQNTMAAQQFSNLASQGGADAGSRARLASSLGSQGLRDQQAARRQGALSRLGIGSQDEATKLRLAEGLSGQQLAIGAEQRAGLGMDQTAALNAAQYNQANQFNQNQANLGIQRDLLGFQFGNLGAEQLARQQAEQSAMARKSGPLGSRGGLLGGGTLPNLFGM